MTKSSKPHAGQLAPFLEPHDGLTPSTQVATANCPARDASTPPVDVGGVGNGRCADTHFDADLAIIPLSSDAMHTGEGDEA